MKIISLDPSGNYGREGMGTTGMCYVENGEIVQLGEVKASDFKTEQAYWFAHWVLLEQELPDYVVMEGFKLYGSKKNEQVNSELQTPQLIGIVKMFCYQWDIPLTIQFASDVKTRWSDDVLVHKGILTEKGNKLYWNNEVTNTHKRDSIRHALHFQRYGRKN